MDEKELIKEAIKEGRPHFAISAIILEGGKILVMRRSPDDAGAGEYEPPGGAVEDGESLNEALARELKEESGLEMTGIKKYIGHCDFQNSKGMKIRRFFFEVKVRDSSRIVMSEHDDYLWASKEELGKLDTNEQKSGIMLRVFD